MDEAPVSVLFGDQSHLQQVLANLLSNATKFTEQGSISLKVTAQPTDENGLTVHFEFKDTGAGVKAESIPSLFDPFGAQGAKTSGRCGGGGLELPICKGLVELMGGEIEMESSKGKGTTVCFSVAAEPDPEDKDWQRIMWAGRDGFLAEEHPYHILVVDDDKVHRKILVMLLRKMGYEPDEAVDGEPAIESALGGDYDRIFMDLRMPKLNGLEATGKIRELIVDNPDLKIIALTGDALRETRRAALRIGMDDFIPKPV